MFVEDFPDDRYRQGAKVSHAQTGHGEAGTRGPGDGVGGVCDEGKSPTQASLEWGTRQRNNPTSAQKKGGTWGCRATRQPPAYFCSTPSTAKRLYFAYFSPILRTASYSGECRHPNSCSMLFQRRIMTRPAGVPSMVVPFPAAI